MKKLLIVLGVMVAGLGAYAQGTISFTDIVIAGGVRTIDAPVSGPGGLLAGSGFTAQLWAGANANSLVAVGNGSPFLSGGGAGYFNGGSIAIPGIAPGSAAVLQVRAWDDSTGATWATATVRGQSATLTITTGGAGSPPGLPANLTGLASFSIVPEPTTIALGVLGAAALLLRRRK